MIDLQRDPLTDKIINSAIAVHKRLGHGLLVNRFTSPHFALISNTDWGFSGNSLFR